MGVSREIIQPPRPSAMLLSLRAIGYSFDTAVADIIDNSIAAGAKQIDISFDINPAWVAIIDDGRGMTEDELLGAMQHGGTGPLASRSPEDLGRYGLGLKTASLSQCRRLTVASLKDGNLSGARWNLDEVERRNEWVLKLPEREEIERLPGCALLMQREHGTLVLWEEFDLATAGEPDPQRALQQLVLECGDHLGLVFHRYLKPEFGKGLTIAVNLRPVEAADPFMRSNPYTEIAGDETRFIEGQKVFLRAYILPHFSHISAIELERAGGKEKLRDTQGFYLYRNRRLITWGTWFRLLARDELTRLARIQVDIPNSLDHLWGIDVKKSTAHPPERVRQLLRQVIGFVANKSVNVFSERRRKRPNDPITYVWERSRIRDAIRYDINRDHPVIRDFDGELTLKQRRNFERILDTIELTLPARSIYLDQASNDPVEQDEPETAEDLRELLSELLARCPSELERDRMISAISMVEPFSSHPKITSALLQELEDARG
jgi:hypothetical protein